MARSRQARYAEVVEDLKAQMLDGRLKIGDPLPSQSMLMQQHNVSTTVVKRVVRELEAAGLVEGQQGKGVYVIKLPDADESYSPELHAVMSEIRKMRSAFEELKAEVQTLKNKRD